jgi:hypothetical protein
VNLSGLLIVVTCLALAPATPALAQVSGGLFGPTRANAAGRDKLTVQFSMAEALDSEVPAEFRSLVPRDGVQSGGRSTMVAAAAAYARDRRSVQLSGSASTYFRYAHRLAGIAAGSQSAQFGAGLRLPKQGRVEISQAAAYSPSYLYQLFPTATLAPGEAIPANPEYRIDETESYSYRSRMSVAFGSLRATRLTATAEYGVTDFKKQAAVRPNLVTYAAGARVSRALSRSAALSLGYDHNTGAFGAGRLTKAHRVTMGVEYAPSISVTRRVTFRFDLSPSIVETPESTAVVVTRRAGGQQVHPLQGEASIDYPFRLKWRANASYRRSVGHVPVLTEPLLATGARVKVMGVIGRRVDISASMGYAAAVSAVSREPRNLTTYTGDARIRYALTRSVAIYSEYLHYSYDLHGLAALAPDLPGVYEQRGIRLGFTVFSQPPGR